MTGPIFANLILADEINRTPPKTQAALLEAMQERQVTAGGHRHVLPDPFFVLATQNPIEQEGTYPLPEAQLDRFLFKIFITYPKPEEERRIYRLTTGAEEHKITAILDGARSLHSSGWSGACRDRPLHRLRDGPGARDPRARPRRPKYIADWVAWGAGPARRPVADLGRQGQGCLDGQAQRLGRRYPVRRLPCCGTASSSTTTLRPPANRATRSSRNCCATFRSGKDLPVPPSRKYSDPDAIAQISDLVLRSRGSSKGRSAVSIAAHFTASTSSSPNTASTPRRRPAAARLAGLPRSDRHYIKQYEEESNVRVTFVVDASNSMATAAPPRSPSSTTAPPWSSRSP